LQFVHVAFLCQGYLVSIAFWVLLQVVALVTDGRQRPAIPSIEDLPQGGASSSKGFPGLPDYVGLMQDCWAQDAEDRPSFGVIISRLRKLLAAEMLSTQSQRTGIGEPWGT
jgi:hypothetical protein